MKELKRKEWLEMGSKSREKLRKKLYQKKFFTDLENMAEPVNTTML